MKRERERERERERASERARSLLSVGTEGAESPERRGKSLPVLQCFSLVDHSGADMEDNQLTESARPNSNTTRKRDDYLEWPEYFMAVAFLSAQRSKDPSSQVGACIVNPENKIVGIGYNGMPNGCDDDLLPWSRTADDRLDTKYPYVCHAELNAIMNKNSADVKGCTMYVALFPCNECAKLIIQAGLKEVVYLSDKYRDSPEMTASRRLLKMAGIHFRQFQPKRTEIVIDFNSINHPGMLSCASK
ncbi:deoxycytidylate deaminase-like isoform X4 [Salarias fasciatus]|uniref:deoxycytidylate deaminase-like isoform X4 n=1 Tax=Salarias fasciatus TaxID=181472 RepID=UPI001176C5E8|nr:deoxycytidylate deaminase-like isoform X4 [Salarias fasciatus]